MIEPIIKGCETPEEAEKKVKACGKTVHPRDAFCGLMAVWYIEANWDEFKKLHQNVGAVGNGIMDAEFLGEAELPRPGDTVVSWKEIE